MTFPLASSMDLGWAQISKCENLNTLNIVLPVSIQITKNLDLLSFLNAMCPLIL